MLSSPYPENYLLTSGMSFILEVFACSLENYAGFLIFFLSSYSRIATSRPCLASARKAAPNPALGK